MAEYHRTSIVGAVVLIAIGVLFLASYSHPELSPWLLLARFWPLLLVFAGITKLWEYYYSRKQAGHGQGVLIAGEIVIVLLLVVSVVALSRHGRTSDKQSVQHQTIDYGGAQSAQVSIQMPAGKLSLSGGSPELLEADLGYPQSMHAPQVSYSIEGTSGQLNIKQEGRSQIHFAPGWNGGDDDWTLKLGDRLPTELKVELGAGRAELNLSGLPLTKLDLQMGAGSVMADLRGNWKNNLDAHIQGGVGNATIRLPKDVGVEVHAQGGIGSVNAHGLTKNGDRYVNDAYGKSPVTVELHVEGGVGSIDLIPE